MEDRVIPQYHSVEMEIKGRCKLDNPFYAELFGIFDGPGGERIRVPGYYDGDGLWKLRFSPTWVGGWEYRIESPHIAIEHRSGTLHCAANDNKRIHGGLIVSPDNPHHFIHQDGTPYFLMAYECDWLWALDLGGARTDRTRDFLRHIKAHGFNQVIMNVYAHDTSWRQGKTCPNDCGPPALFLWEGSNESPDHSRMNLDFFRHFDAVMRLLLEEGLTAHLFFKVYNKYVNWPAKYSLQDDLYFKYIVCRYQAFPNVIWDYAKESYYETDKDYIKNRLELIRMTDGYHRLVTIHDDRLFYARDSHARTLDFHTGQQHHDLHASALLERGKREWPVFNSEFGYECGPKGTGDLTYNVGHSAEELVKRAYQVVMAGAYPAYYHTYTAWDVIEWDLTPPGYRYFKILHDFFTSIEWWRFRPGEEYSIGSGGCVLAIPSREYVVFGEVVALNLEHLNGLGFSSACIDIFTGDVLTGGDAEPTTGSVNPALHIFRSPFPGQPGLWHLKVEV